MDFKISQKGANFIPGSLRAYTVSDTPHDASFLLNDEHDIVMGSLRRENWILLSWLYIP